MAGDASPSAPVSLQWFCGDVQSVRHPWARGSHSFAAAGNALWLFGGNACTTGDAEDFDDFWRYQLRGGPTEAHGYWAQIDPGDAESKSQSQSSAPAPSHPQNSDMPTARNGHATAYDSLSQRVIIFGGCTEGGAYFNDIHAWDVTGEGEVVRPLARRKCGAADDAPSPRAHHSASYHRGKVWVFGGCDSDVEYNDLYCLDLSSWAWRRCDARPPPSLTPRFCHAAVVRGGRLYIFGGCGDDNLNDMHSFDLVGDDGWRVVTNVGRTPAPTPRYSLSASADPDVDCVFYLFAGDNDDNKLNDLYACTVHPDGASCEWAALGATDMAVSEHKSVCADGKLFVCGGQVAAKPRLRQHWSTGESLSEGPQGGSTFSDSASSSGCSAHSGSGGGGDDDDDGASRARGSLHALARVFYIPLKYIRSAARARGVCYGSAAQQARGPRLSVSGIPACSGAAFASEVSSDGRTSPHSARGGGGVCMGFDVDRQESDVTGESQRAFAQLKQRLMAVDAAAVAGGRASITPPAGGGGDSSDRDPQYTTAHSSLGTQESDDTAGRSRGLTGSRLALKGAGSGSGSGSGGGSGVNLAALGSLGSATTPITPFPQVASGSQLQLKRQSSFPVTSTPENTLAGSAGNPGAEPQPQPQKPAAPASQKRLSFSTQQPRVVAGDAAEGAAAATSESPLDRMASTTLASSSLPHQLTSLSLPSMLGPQSCVSGTSAGLVGIATGHGSYAHPASPLSSPAAAGVYPQVAAPQVPQVQGHVGYATTAPAAGGGGGHGGGPFVAAAAAGIGVPGDSPVVGDAAAAPQHVLHRHAQPRVPVIPAAVQGYPLSAAAAAAPGLATAAAAAVAAAGLPASPAVPTVRLDQLHEEMQRQTRALGQHMQECTEYVTSDYASLRKQIQGLKEAVHTDNTAVSSRLAHLEHTVVNCMLPTVHTVNELKRTTEALAGQVQQIGEMVAQQQQLLLRHLQPQPAPAFATMYPHGHPPPQAAPGVAQPQPHVSLPHMQVPQPQPSPQ